MTTKPFPLSEILFPARERAELDWTTIDKLTKLNNDFKHFLVGITEDIKMGKVKSQYDPVMSDEEMEKHVSEKGIKG